MAMVDILVLRRTLSRERCINLIYNYVAQSPYENRTESSRIVVERGNRRTRTERETEKNGDKMNVKWQPCVIWHDFPLTQKIAMRPTPHRCAYWIEIAYFRLIQSKLRFLTCIRFNWCDTRQAASFYSNRYFHLRLRGDNDRRQLNCSIFATTLHNRHRIGVAGPVSVNACRMVLPRSSENGLSTLMMAFKFFYLSNLISTERITQGTQWDCWSYCHGMERYDGAVTE